MGDGGGWVAAGAGGWVAAGAGGWVAAGAGGCVAAGGISGGIGVSVAVPSGGGDSGDWNAKREAPAIPGESTAAIRRATTNQGSQANARWAWPRMVDKNAESESDFNRGSLLLLRFIGRLAAHQQDYSANNQARQYNPPRHQWGRAIIAARRLRDRRRRRRCSQRRNAADSRHRRDNRRLRRRWRDE